MGSQAGSEREREDGVCSSDTNEGEGGQNNEGGPLFSLHTFGAQLPLFNATLIIPIYIHK